MSAPMSSSRTIIRQSRNILRQNQYRQASSTTEKAGEAASKAKETVSTNVSKASEGLSKVQSSASSTITNAASSAQAALGRVGGRTGRLIRFVECEHKWLLWYVTWTNHGTAMIPPTIYYSRVGLELGRLMAQHQKMTPPWVLHDLVSVFTDGVQFDCYISILLPAPNKCPTKSTINHKRSPNHKSGSPLTST